MLSDEAKRNVLRRLRRTHGQLAAIIRMVESDDYCVDVLLQVSAVQGALRKTGRLVLGSHIETCVRSAFVNGDENERQDKIEELLEVFERYGGKGR